MVIFRVRILYEMVAQLREAGIAVEIVVTLARAGFFLCPLLGFGGALVFGSFAQDDGVFFFIVSRGDAGGGRVFYCRE